MDEVSAESTQDSPAPPPGPLAGLLVADFSRVLAGPYCTMILGDLGAEVIKVEGPGGDDTRHWMPPVRQGISTYYLSINRNKRSIQLNLKDDADRAMAAELARRADIMVENFKPGGLRQFGLDYDRVRAVNPAVIYASITGFGSGGGAHLPGYDLIVEAMSGLMSLQGDARRTAVPGRHRYVRRHVGVADRDRRASSARAPPPHWRGPAGRGQPARSSASRDGQPDRRIRLSGGRAAPDGQLASQPVPVRAAADRSTATSSSPPAMTRSSAACVACSGSPELAADERFAANSGRTANRDELRPLLVERLKQRTAAQWFDDLIAAGVPCGPINTVAGGVAFAEQIGLQPVVTAGQGDSGVPGIRNPLTVFRHGSALRPAATGPGRAWRPDQGLARRQRVEAAAAR